MYVALLLPVVLIPMPLIGQLVWFGGVMTMALYIDAVTVRLVEVRRWRGILLGYGA